MRAVVLVLCCVACAGAARVLLVFPVPGASHAILAEGYITHLVRAGHQVTAITPIPSKNPAPNLRQIDVSANFLVSPFGDILQLEKIMNKEIDMKDLSLIKVMMNYIANATFHNPNVKRLMEDPKEQFDVVIAEWLYTELYSGFASIFNCPLIWSSSMDPHALVLWLIDEAPNPAYVADHLSDNHPPFTFWERAKELWVVIRWMWMEWSSRTVEEAIYNAGYGPAAAKRGVVLSPLTEVKYNASLMLGNSHVSIGQSMRLPQNYKSILGYHVSDEVKPLPEHIKKIMDEANHGVIYFSMGSMLKSKTFPNVLKKELLQIFSSFKQTVLWKFEETPSDLPENVHVVQWAPQQDILAHPNCTLFITHGGLLSLTETVHFGVPIIGIPMYADQFLNTDRAVRKGFGKKVYLDWDMAKNLKVAIEEVLGNPSYHQKAKEVSHIYHDRPVRPGSELVHWVEHVVTTRGAPHLRSQALNVPFYQKMYLDLVAVVLMCLLVVVKIIIILMSISKGKEKQY